MRAGFVRKGLRAAMPAALLSGLPSTLHAVMTGRDPLEASMAAGSILLQKEGRRLPLVAAAVPVHMALSVGWAIILAATLPRKYVVTEGTLAGLAIAAIDFGWIGGRHPRIRALESIPQIADHVAFGIIATVALARQEAQS